MSINTPLPLMQAKVELRIRAAGGNRSIMVTVEELAAYNADPDKFAAENFGLTVPQYEEWIAVDGAPLCGATTKAGKLCSVMLGRVQMGPDEWLALHREQYCHAHGG